MEIMVAGKGKMLGDLEAFEGGPCQTSAICHSTNALVWYVKRQEYANLFKAELNKK